MPIAVHSSSPTIVSGSGPSVTTAAFTPPAGSLLVACALSKNDTTMALTGNGQTLTWTQRKLAVHTNGCAAIYTAPAAGSQLMSVTGALDQTASLALKIFVLTGVQMGSPVGATGSTQSSGVENWSFSAYTSTEAGSWGICAACDDYQTATPTSNDVYETFNVSSSLYLSGLAIRKASATAAAGTPVSFDIRTGGPSGSTRWAAAAVEIRAAPEGQPAVPRMNPLAAHRAATW
ncbi:hypothetical protein [Planomonospora sp. ID82291]|uniref:hypothetical protein n=1 Tax=Planomonospora sp. ID82291 TaxID=2738136 RepID=UPI0018C371E4|nr:hypothetical protein [Planomonospora sp. ID82291]MBG0818249.1 hypothetical protein [Planomonospora sp. ID82291]